MNDVQNYVLTFFISAANINYIRNASYRFSLFLKIGTGSFCNSAECHVSLLLANCTRLVEIVWAYVRI